MSLVRRVAGASAIAGSSRQSVAPAWRLLAAPLLFVVALLAVTLGIASPALAAAPTANDFSTGGTPYNTGTNPTTVINVWPHVAGGPTGFAMVSTTSDWGGRATMSAGGTISYYAAIGFTGIDKVQYVVSNADGTSAPATVTINVNWPNITVGPPPGGAAVGVPYNAGGAPLTIAGGAAPYTFAFTSALPSGMSFDPATKVLSGTPTDAGSFAAHYTVTDSSFGQTGNHTKTSWITFNIAAPTITVSPPAMAGSPAVGAAYSQTLTASGGTAPYGYTVTAGALPAGLSLSPGGVVSGTPTAAGTFNVTVRAMDNAGYTGDRAYGLTVAAPAMTTSPGVLPGGNLGTPYTASVTGSGATAPYSYQVTAGALPTGLSLSTSGATAGTISGTPIAGGIFNFTISVTDSSTGTNAPFTMGRAYAVIITAPTVTVSPGGLLDGRVGQAYSAGITASGAQAPYSFAVTAGALPAGLSLGAGGALTGTPTASGTFNFTVMAADSNGVPAMGSRAYSLTIVAPTLTLQPGLLPNATLGETYSAPFTTGGGSSPYSYAVSAGALPPGVSLSPTGLLSGTPTALGTFNFSVTTTDSTTGGGPYSLAQPYSLLVATPAPPIASPAALTLAANSPGQPVVLTLGGGTATGVAVGAVTPAHGTLNIAGLTMTYIPDPGYSGPDSFTYTAFNITGHSPEETVSVTVTPPTLTLSALATTGQVTALYSATATASLGTAPYSFARTAGALPDGLTLTAGGSLSGTPTVAGAFNFTLEATDAYGATGSRAYTVTIDAPTIAITAPAAGALPGVMAGTAYSETFTATGGQGAHSFSITAGALPPGIALSGAGILSGTPTTPGAFNFSVTPRDSSGAPGPHAGPPVAYSLTVAAPTITVSPAAGALPGGLITVPYSQSFTASGGAAPFGFAVTAGAVPGGLTLSGAGALTGTPALAGNYSFSVTATDAFGFDQTVAYTLAIGTPIPVAESKAATLIPGQSATIDAAAGATGGPFTAVTVTTAPVHGTAVISGLTILYTPNGGYTGVDSFTYTLTNAGGASLPATVSITIAPAIVVGPPKTVTILAGQTATVELTVGATGAPFTGAAVLSLTPADAGTATITGRTGPAGQLYDLIYTPDDAFDGQAVVTYTLSNASATSAPGTVTIVIEPRPDPGLDPEVRGLATSQVMAARRFADAQTDNFQRRLQALRDGANASSNGLSLNLGLGGSNDDQDPRVALRRQLGQQSSRLDPGSLDDGRDREMLGLDLWVGRAPTGATDPVAPTGDRLNVLTAQANEGRRSIGVWTAGSVDWGRQDAEGARDSRFTTQGVSAGLDVRVNDRLIVGGGLGYGEDRTKIGDMGSITDGSAITAALYASWRPAQAFYIDGVIGFADLDFSSRRWAQGLGGEASGYAEGSRAGDARFASAAFGRMIRREGWTSDLYARLDAREMTLDAFTETGGGLSSLAWDALDQSSLSANLGASLRWSLESRRYGRVMPSARLEWSHELEDIGVQGVRYADWAASPTYLVPLDEWSRNAINLDLGVEWSLTDRLMFSLGYRIMQGDASSSQGAQIGLKYGW